MQELATIVRRAALFAAALAVTAQPHSPQMANASEPSAETIGPPNPDALLGEWWTEDQEGRVRFVKQKDGAYKGITTWRAPAPSTEDNPAIDIHNPNPEKRGRSTTGIVIIWDLSYEDGKYREGYVYNPRDGGVYRFEAKLVDQDTLKVRGYWGIRLLGGNQIWKRRK